MTCKLTPPLIFTPFNPLNSFYSPSHFHSSPLFHTKKKSDHKNRGILSIKTEHPKFMKSMEELRPKMQIQESHQIPTSSLVQEKPVLASPEHDDQLPQQQPQQQQQQQQKRPNEGNSDEEEGKSTNTRESESGGKHEEEQKENTTGDHGNNEGVTGPRERLKRHRREVAGQVWIPDMWGQEDFMKDWIDCSAFDASLVPQGIMLARASLMEEGRRSNSNTLIVENSC